MGHIWLLYLHVLIIIEQCTVSLTSVLDLPTCYRGVITREVWFSPNNSLITKKSQARSLAECVVNCYSSFPVRCNAVFKDSENICYEINGDVDEIDYDANNLYRKGHLVDIMSTGKHSNCNGRSCSSSEVCMAGCSEIDLSLPVCIADQRDACELDMEYNNIIHYWMPIRPDDKDNGVVMQVTYPKDRSDTGIRVILHMNIRGHHQSAGGCNRWYLTFNGNKCTNPASIDMVAHSESTGDLHRAMDLDGTCYDVNSGDVTIELVVENHCDGVGTSNAYSGWNSARTMVVMEIQPQDPNTGSRLRSCPLLSSFNYKYETWNEEIDETFDLSLGGHMIKTISYEKFADDTSLRIKYAAPTAVVNHNNVDIHCARWYVKIDGVECAPQLDFLIFANTPNQYAYWQHQTRGRTAEGICDNDLVAGTHTIEIWVGMCVDTSWVQPTRVITGGFNSPSRLHVEEVRRDHVVDGVSSRHEMYRSHSGNIVRHHWWQLNDDNNNADILSVTYVKEFADTGLRLTASGVHRIIHGGGNARCGRWFFKIDRVDCSNPGNIEGVHHFNYNSDFHSPMQVSGICHGITTGSHVVSYAVGICAHYSTTTNAYTGYRSSFHILIEELRVELVQIL